MDHKTIRFNTFQILLYHDVHYFYDIRSMQRHPLSLASCTAPLYFLPKWFHPLVLVLRCTTAYYEATTAVAAAVAATTPPTPTATAYLPTYLQYLPTYLPTYQLHDSLQQSELLPSPGPDLLSHHCFKWISIVQHYKNSVLFASVLESFEPSLITADGFSLSTGKLTNCSAWEPNKASLFKTNKKKSNDISIPCKSRSRTVPCASALDHGATRRGDLRSYVFNLSQIWGQGLLWSTHHCWIWMSTMIHAHL